MKKKFKSSVSKQWIKRITLCVIDASLILFICYAYFTLRKRAAENEDQKFIVFGEDYKVQSPAVGPEELLWLVQQNQAELKILNTGTYPGHDNKMPVVVVQAGRRPARLQRLLASLAKVENIGDAMLVVSHSFYDDAINELVRRVSYCRVLQLHYPYSIQLFPDRYPGPEAKRSPAVAAAAEHKQHWWWTASFIFNHYAYVETKFSGLVLFLQEDDYVAPDLLYALKYAQRAFLYHPEAEVISLGRPAGRDMDYSMLTVMPWQPPFETGLAFNRTMWRKLQEYSIVFCQYNDASWSYSLFAAFSASPRGYVDMVVTVAPRVFSTRDYASGAEGAAAVSARLSKAALFPSRVRSAFLATADGRVAHPEPVPAGVGGWTDRRDLLLCLDPFLMTTPEPARDNTSTLQQHILSLPGT